METLVGSDVDCRFFGFSITGGTKKSEGTGTHKGKTGRD